MTSNKFPEDLQEQPAIREFAEWCEQNMPCQAITAQANAIVSGMIGNLIGALFDAGADKATVQEYFRRFIDVGWGQFQRALRQAQAADQEVKQPSS